MKIVNLISKKNAFLYGISTVFDVFAVLEEPTISKVSSSFPYNNLGSRSWKVVGDSISGSIAVFDRTHPVIVKNRKQYKRKTKPYMIKIA